MKKKCQEVGLVRIHPVVQRVFAEEQDEILCAGEETSTGVGVNVFLGAHPWIELARGR